MNEPKPDQITVPLDDRLPPHYRETIDQLFGRNCHLESLVRAQATEIAYLRDAVELLSLPRPTEDDIRAVRDGLLQLQMQRPERMH